MTMYVLLNMYIQYVPPIERLWIEEWIKDDKKFTTISLKVAASEQVLKTLVKSIEESWRQDPECYSEEARRGEGKVIRWSQKQLSARMFCTDI